ncbi:MAG: hypothetical protein EBR01_05730 [Proteobacteria bacterium]|nr:hypothetical protein [Pseudomonadota bacterium]NBY20385.1 hypothetical protein [bacterium]
MRGDVMRILYCADMIMEEEQLKRLMSILILGVVLICHSSFAERRAMSSTQKKLSGLLYGGFSFTNHKGESAGNLKGQTGLAFGFGLDYKIMNEISLGIDMLYAQKSYQTSTLTSVTQYDLSYLEFPVYVKWSPIREFQLKVGPYLAGMMVSANRQVSGVDSAIKGEFANDFGISYGGWIGFWANPKLAVGIDMRYDMGFANIQNVAQPTSAIRTRTFISMLTLTFGLK